MITSTVRILLLTLLLALLVVAITPRIRPDFWEMIVLLLLACAVELLIRGILRMWKGPKKPSGRNGAGEEDA